MHAGFDPNVNHTEGEAKKKKKSVPQCDATFHCMILRKEIRGIDKQASQACAMSSTNTFR